MADDKLNLGINIDDKNSAKKLADNLSTAKLNAKQLADITSKLKVMFNDITRFSAALNKEMQFVVKATQNMQMMAMAQERQSKAALDRATLENQIKAQTFRSSQAQLRNEQLSGTAKEAHLRTVQKEQQALTDLVNKQKQLVTAEKDSEATKRRSLSISQKIRQVADQYRITRSANAAAGVSDRDDRLQRIGLIIQRQQLAVDRARVVAAGQYTAELARQEARLIKLRSAQTGIRQSPEDPRVVRRVDPVSLFRVQADIFANYAVMGQALNMIRFASQTVVQFDKEMRDLQAVAELTNTEMKSLGDTVVDVSTKTKFSAVEVANAATVMAQAGFTGPQIKEAIGAIALLATATGTDLTKSVDVATSALTMFNLNVNETMRVANVMTGALNLSKLNMDKLQYGLQYAGNTAATMGINLEELTASLGAMSNAGIKSGSTLGTGLNQLMVTLQSPTKKMREEISRLGLSLADIDVESRGLIPVIETLRKAGFSSAQAFSAMELRAARAYLAFSNNVDSAKDYYQALQITNAAQKANDVQMQSFANTAQKLSNNLGQLFINAGRVMLPALTGIADAVTYVVSALNQIPLATTSALTALTTLAGLALTQRILQLVFGVTSLTSAFSALAKGAMALKAAGSLGGVFTLITTFLRANPIGLIVTGVTILTAAFAALSGSSASAAAELDRLGAKANEAAGDYAKAKDQIGTVDQAISRISKRYTELNKNSELLRTETIALQARFADLGIYMSTDLVGNANDLISALQNVRGELAKTAFAKASQWLIDQRGLAEASVKQSDAAISSAAGKNFVDNSFYGGRAKEVANARSEVKRVFGLDLQTNTANSTARSELMKSVGDVTMMTRTQLRQMEDLVLSDRSAAASDIVTLNKIIAEGKFKDQKLSNEQKKVLKAAIDQLTNVQQTTTESFNNVHSQAKALSATQEGLLNMSGAAATELAKLEAIVTKGNAQITKSKSQGGATKAMETILENTAKEAESFKKQLLDPQSSVFKKIQSETGQTAEQLTENLSSAFGYRIAKLGADISDANHDLSETLGKGTTEFFDRYSQSIETESKRLDFMIKRAGDAAATRMAPLNAVVEANSNINSPLYGKYSDAEITMIKNDQAKIEIDNLKAQAKAYEEAAPKFTQYANQQEELYNKAKIAADSAKAGTREQDRALKALNETMDNYYTARQKEADIKLKLVEINAQLGAQSGEELVAHKTIAEQIGSVVDNYMKRLSVEGDFFANLEKNIVHVLDESRSAFGSFVKDVATGSKSIGDSFRDMASRIIESMLDIAAQQAATGLFGLFSSAASSVMGWVGGYSAVPDTLPNIPMFSANSGGLVPKHFASGGKVGTRDSVNAILRPGEFVMRNSAVNAIGVDNLRQMNAAGNSRVSDSAGNLQANPVVGNVTPVNVYVVSPDQKPALTKNDVIVAVTDDMYKGGSTAKLIKTIVAGNT